jgi:23S rRNA (cytidine1920-2'-O)/16S rRNA (cytidine1409-2'-O)-methyltransferase
VLPPVHRLICHGGDIVALVKPQFEVGKGKVGKGGVVRSRDEQLRVVDEIKVAAQNLGLIVQGVTESPLLGPAGNREFFLYLKDSRERQ